MKRKLTEMKLSATAGVGAVLSNGVKRACLNVMGKMPAVRDVFMMCMTVGKSVDEMA